MEAYTGFAQVYDKFMDDIPYEQWSKYLINLLKKYGVNDGLVLELGCGTGSITMRMAEAGFDMIGVDNSQEMLNIANEKKFDAGYDILYLNQDMREFELYGTVGAVVSICDSMNYIDEYEDLVEVFRLANNYLDPGGVFVFDMKTVKFFANMGDKTIAENRSDSSFIWENTYYEEDQVNEYELTIFVRNEDGRYERFTEEHYQKAYTIETVKKAVTEAGMEFVASYDAFTMKDASEDNDRVYFVVRESGK